MSRVVHKSFRQKYHKVSCHCHAVWERVQYPIKKDKNKLCFKWISSNFKPFWPYFFHLLGGGCNWKAWGLLNCSFGKVVSCHIFRILASLSPHEWTWGILQDWRLHRPEILRLSKQCRLFLTPSRWRFYLKIIDNVFVQYIYYLPIHSMAF